MVDAFGLDKTDPFEINFHYVHNPFPLRGEPVELVQNMRASLQVGLFDRAEALLQRLGEIFPPSNPQLVEAHNLYIRANVEAIVRNPNGDRIGRLQYWFEREMRRNGIQPNETTLALMCRASITALSGERQVRSLRRYLEIAAEKTRILAQLLDSGEFTHSEWRTLNLLIESHSDISQESSPIARDTPFLEEPTTKPLQIQSVEQRGLGLQTLKKSLVSLEDSDDATMLQKMHGDLSAYYQWKFEQQERLEQDSIDAAVDEWRAEHENMVKMGINPAFQSKSIKAMLWNWYSALLPKVQKEIESVKTKEDKIGTIHLHDTVRYAPYFALLPPEKLCAITIVCTLQELVSEGIAPGVKLGRITLKIAAALQDEAGALWEKRVGKSKKAQRRTKKLAKQAATPKAQEPSNTSAKGTSINVVELDEAKYLMSRQTEWPVGARVMVGGTLLAKLVQVARIDVRQQNLEAPKPEFKPEPALRHDVTYVRGKHIGLIHAHDALRELLAREPPRGLLGARLPMLVEPKPWESPKDGGFLTLPSRLVRDKTGDETQKMYLFASAARGDLDQLFKSLNVLGRTPWRINEDLLTVMAEAWNTGEAIADIPPANPDIPYPPEPSTEEGDVAKAIWLRRRQAIDNEIGGYHSNRCFQNLQLEVARAFLGKSMYFPHNIDFRGRAYPMPPFLNHMGADNARGLLQFGVAKELGEQGLFWLKVQVANLHGFDKASLTERADFTASHIEDIRDSAANPLTGSRWWLKAADPWQCLAACMDLVKAIDSPDPSKYKSSLPVHQDGTCNGLQHYAALGGDSFGAAQVNLEPGERPADVYSGVANLVKAAIKEEVAEGHPMALALDGKITRKVVKQTVMTNVYGVTFVGARDQVQRQLDDIMPDRSESNVSNYQLAAYIAHKIFKALSTMFQGAHDIQDWFGQCAFRISTAVTAEQIDRLAKRGFEKKPKPVSKGSKPPAKLNRASTIKLIKEQFQSSVIWTTPLKLTVVQPYRASDDRQVQSTLQSITIKQPKLNDAVSKRKQLQGFPPNFVHSLDATHMMLTALKCDELGLTFASVHDSFWTHAADVPVMNRVLREAFVAMHSENIIDRLAEELKARHRGSLYLATVKARSAVGKKIKKFRAERYKTMAKKGSWQLDELIEEKKRQDLLNSADEEDQRLGREMVTPASIYEAHAQSTSILEVSLQQEAEEVLEAEVEEEVKALQADANAHTAETKPQAKAKPSFTLISPVWLPLTFPPVPEKGDFDVRRVRDSPYFFS
ncbi:DNA/RNA polymerase [Eremomyces bilateralis CBS 781.70]|uniref:DNA-directed RNA polymerase n=1 Tax=Eremomyces bilateralis CBS 781.70 TaxID=1392243 RepID=A0A6G1G870_9PEZI|nr:DNA/RNA polymerase [Eremomyces bilateralis CBS 781.70]KAF1814121.1 DNA/RNA polymerase [Eremomyces bilateralis CBS 781.70]